MVLWWIVASVLAVSAVSLVGILMLFLRDKTFHSLLVYFVSFAAGALLGAAFFNLLPEGVEEIGVQSAMLFALVGIVVFLVIEKFLHWYHRHRHYCPREKPKPEPFTYLNLIGDGAHNFVDGAVIAATYMSDVSLGILSTIAIMAHEIPQEIGDFCLLVYGGFSKNKALAYNLFGALTAVVGALATYYFLDPVSVAALVPFAAGGFIYIACADLVPEMHKEKESKKSAITFASFIFGIVIIFLASVFLKG